MPSRIFAIFAVIAAAAGGYYYFFWNAEAEQATASAGPPGGFAVPVEVAPVETRTIVESIPAVGTLGSSESVIISSEIEGRISRLNFDEGTTVEKGTLLAELSAEVYQAELAQAEARLTLSQRNHERAVELQRQGAGTVRALDEAAATLRNDEAAVSLAKARLGKTRITAPFSGVLGLRRASVGAYVEAGAPIVNLEAIDPIIIDFRIPEIHLTALHVGQYLDITLDALPGETFKGQVYAIDPQVDVSGRSLRVRAGAYNPDGRLKPGLFAHIDLIKEQRENALMVPERSLVPIGENQFVFKVVDGKAVQTKVSIGTRQDGQVEIRDGLAADDTVVTDGQIKLTDGTAVTFGNGGEGGKDGDADGRDAS